MLDIDMVNAGLDVAQHDGHVFNGGDPDHVPMEFLENELPRVWDGQVELKEVITRTTQDIFADLVNLSETLPTMSDLARKRTLADWVVNTKRQVVKLLAIVKWARDAHDVQKAMNITAFLMDQNRQFDDVVRAIDASKESLKLARLRNHDLLTSLDVLTTGTYQRLPLSIKENFIPPKPFTNDQVAKTMSDFEDLIRYRLRMDEIVPAQMASYRVADGRAYFHVENLFDAAVCLRGARPDDGWFFVGVEFHLNVVGDVTATQEFPRVPPGPLKQMLTDEADMRLGVYVPKPIDPNIPPDQIPSQPSLPDGTVDAPLVRLFNYLQMMSLSYQLEILYYQAMRLRSLGWAEYLKIEMSPDRKTLTASYWLRKPPQVQRPAYQAARNPLPLLGGKLIISIEPTPARDPLLTKMALRNRKPSDTPESFGLSVKWEPSPGTWGIVSLVPPPADLIVDAQALDFEGLLLRALRTHAYGIMQNLYIALMQTRPLSVPGVLALHPTEPEMRMRFCGDDATVVVVNLDLRTGRMGMREETDLSGRVDRLVVACDRINENPLSFGNSILHLRTATIIEDAEHKVSALGLECYRFRNISPEDRAKFGHDNYGLLYIRLALFQAYYLVVVIGDETFRYATITTRSPQSADNYTPKMEISDLGFLEPARVSSAYAKAQAMNAGRFRLDVELLKELYAYCCARVSYTLIEQQLRNRGIGSLYVRAAAFTDPLTHAQFASAVPVLCVSAETILAGSPAGEAAMPNIQITPLNWWSERKCQVVTSVKLKYVQPPVAPSTNTPTPLPTPGRQVQQQQRRKERPPPPRMMRPSKSIVYDTQEAVVSFLSEDVETCVEEFLDQWTKVSRMVLIAREVTTMAKAREWTDVRLLAFDLQTVEFTYAAGFAVTISCTDDFMSAVVPVPGERSYSLKFRTVPSAASFASPEPPENPHADMRELLEKRMSGDGSPSVTVRPLVEALRASLGVVLELDAIRSECEDVRARSVTWWRVLYPGRRAVDVRLLDEGMAMILDASHTHSHSHSSHSPHSDEGWLKPIDAFKEISVDVLRTIRGKGRVALVDAGVVCERGVVRDVLRDVHRRVRERGLSGSA